MSILFNNFHKSWQLSLTRNFVIGIILVCFAERFNEEREKTSENAMFLINGVHTLIVCNIKGTTQTVSDWD